jgi:hypothetical protein
MNKFREYLQQKGYEDPEDSVHQLPIFQQIVCGGTAGVIEHFGLFPIDTIKV